MSKRQDYIKAKAVVIKSIVLLVDIIIIKATHDDGTTFTGKVYKIVIQPCKDDNNRPHAMIFISQDKRFIEQEGEFGCVSEWVDKLKSIEILEKSNKEQ